jgi:hypothetical protein
MGPRYRRTGHRSSAARSMRALACGTLLGTVASLKTGSADAAPIAFSLTWEAPAPCPDSDYLRAQIETLLAGAPPSVVPVTARAEISQRADGMWTVKLTTERGGTVGERSLTADACRSLADATALVIALTIDPAHVAGAGAEPPSPPPEASLPTPQPMPSPPALLPAAPRTPPAPPVTASRAAPPSKPNQPRPRFAILPAIGGDLGTLPGPAYGFSLFGAILMGRFRGEAYASYWPNQTAHAPAGSPAGEGANIELFDGGLRFCFPAPDESRRFSSFELSPCAGFEAGALHGRGFDLAPSLSQTGLWLAFTLDARAIVRLSRSWGIALDLGGALPLRRDAFTLGAGPKAPTLQRAQVIEGRGWIGPEFRF